MSVSASAKPTPWHLNEYLPLPGSSQTDTEVQCSATQTRPLEQRDAATDTPIVHTSASSTQVRSTCAFCPCSLGRGAEGIVCRREIQVTPRCSIRADGGGHRPSRFLPGKAAGNCRQPILHRRFGLEEGSSTPAGSPLWPSLSPVTVAVTVSLQC
jgi:hypothetical protein